MLSKYRAILAFSAATWCLLSCSTRPTPLLHWFLLSRIALLHYVYRNSLTLCFNRVCWFTTAKLWLLIVILIDASIILVLKVKMVIKRTSLFIGVGFIINVLVVVLRASLIILIKFICMVIYIRTYLSYSSSRLVFLFIPIERLL